MTTAPFRLAKPATPAEPPFMRRLRLRARRRVLWMRVLWANGLAGTEQGLAISHAEVDRILEDPAALAGAEAVFYDSNDSARALSLEIDEADLDHGRDAKWAAVIDDFDLSEPEADLLSMTVAIEFDPLFKRVYGYLNDDATAVQPTQGLARALFGWDMSVRISADSALVRWVLAMPLDGTWTETSPWVADPVIVAWLASEPGQRAPLDPALDGDAVLISGCDELECLYPEELRAMKELARSVRVAGKSALTLELTAAEGAGKRTLSAQFAQELAVGLLAVDASALTRAADNGIRAVRLARLTGSLLYWHSVENVDARMWRLVTSANALTIIGATSPLKWHPTGTPLHAFRLPPLTAQQRIAVWKQLAGPACAVPKQISEWSLSPAEIRAAATAASVGEGASDNILRRVVYRSPGELFTPLACPYTWNDIVLPDTLRDHLSDLETQARLRGQVYDEWGFRRLVPLGGGITSLFAGPSGTGKTMAAQVLARSLGMDLYRVDLAGVINKYIGETEKRLKQVFEACEGANVMLFFDEADALFGRRTEVKDAHDRYANIQIDYLLQRMEQFEGIAILATNRKGDLDQAFFRRIRFIIDFIPPGPSERLALWHKALNERSPSGISLLDDIDWGFLAAKLTMTGADIKAAALSAAFRARNEGKRIGMKHILDAARRELTKHGITMRTGDKDFPAQ